MGVCAYRRSDAPRPPSYPPGVVKTPTPDAVSRPADAKRPGQPLQRSRASNPSGKDFAMTLAQPRPEPEDMIQGVPPAYVAIERYEVQRSPEHEARVQRLVELLPDGPSEIEEAVWAVVAEEQDRAYRAALKEVADLMQRTVAHVHPSNA